MPSVSKQTVKNYCTLIGRSKLMTPDAVKDVFRHWQETAKGSPEDDADSFRKYLVSRKLLTEYQSQLLLRGHSEGFFIDKYKIVDLIGKGRMAGVYKGVHPSGQVVAIKVLPPSKAKDPTILSRFQREGKLLTKLDHPNVVRAFQIGEAGGRHYFVMEYLEGEPLNEVIDRRNRLPAGEAVRLIHQALLGLQHVFEQGMVHRDLKPANLILVPAPDHGPAETSLNSTLKILDIGLGRATFDEATKEPDPNTQLTSEGALLGTPGYLAPEQARNAHDVDIRADIYSLGCVLYHLLTGQMPFPTVPNESVIQQVVRHATETPRPLTDFLTEVPDGLQQVLNWLMAKDPNQRYPTPSRAAQALQMFLLHTKELVPATGPAAAYLQYLQTGAPTEIAQTAASSIPKASSEPPKASMAKPAVEAAKSIQPVERQKESAPSKPFVANLHRVDVVPPDIEEYDVEVIGISPPQQAALKKRPASESRGLLELDRRDFIMASFGAALVIFAILFGWGMSRLLKGSTSTATTPSEQKEEETQTLPKKKQPEENVEQGDEKKPAEKKAEVKKAEKFGDGKRIEEMKKSEDKKDPKTK